MLYTRWHENDLAGNLLIRESSVWKVNSYEILKTARSKDERDTRKIGDALWPERHAKEKAERWRARDPVAFESLGQQNPKPAKGLMYPQGFKIYSRDLIRTLEEEGVVKSYTDTADTGSDYLATIIFWEYKNQAYIKDIIYTQEAMDVTIPLWAKKTAENSVLRAKIEYNNGGHPFKLYAEDKLKNLFHYRRCHIEGFHQRDNKQARILSQAAWIQENVFFPENWHLLWSEACLHLVNYRREGKNDHDDIEDCLTGVAEMITQGNNKIKAAHNPYQ